MKNKKNVNGGGGQKSAKKVSRIIWMAPKYELKYTLLEFQYTLTEKVKIYYLKTQFDNNL
jgi:hypothetical protein